MLDFVPDADRLVKIFSQAAAPTFFLGAVAAFVSLMNTRLVDVVARLRVASERSAEGDAGATEEAVFLRRRSDHLHSGIAASLRSGMCSTALLAILFVSEFVGFQHAYGAPLLFVIATLLLGYALYRFYQDVRMSVEELDRRP